MCVIKHNGKEVGKVPACAVNAEAYINELASHYGSLNIEYVYDRNAAFLAAMHGGVRRDIPKIDSTNEEVENYLLQEALKKKIDPKGLLKWWNDRKAKQAKQAGETPPKPLKFSKQTAKSVTPPKPIKPDKLDKLLLKAKQPNKPTSTLAKLIQKAREMGTKGNLGSKLKAPSIFKMPVGKPRGRAVAAKPVSITNIEPPAPPPPPFVPQWKEPKIDIIRTPEPQTTATEPSGAELPSTQPTTSTNVPAPTPAPKSVEPPKVTVTQPPETLPDTTANISVDYNNVRYTDLNTTKQYEIERLARDKTIAERNAFRSVDNETYMRLSKYVEMRTKRLESWRQKLKNEVTSIIEGMPMGKIVVFSSANMRTNVFIRKGQKLGTVHYGIIDVASETRWVSQSDFYGGVSKFQNPLRREPDPVRYYVSPQERKPKYERTSEIDTLIARMIGITDKPTLGVFALDKALVKYRFADKSMYGFKDEEEPFARSWDPSRPRSLEELKNIIHARIAENLLIESVRHYVE